MFPALLLNIHIAAGLTLSEPIPPKTVACIAQHIVGFSRNAWFVSSIEAFISHQSAVTLYRAHNARLALLMRTGTDSIRLYEGDITPRQYEDYLTAIDQLVLFNDKSTYKFLLANFDFTEYYYARLDEVFYSSTGIIRHPARRALRPASEQDVQLLIDLCREAEPGTGMYDSAADVIHIICIAGKINLALDYLEELSQEQQDAIADLRALRELVTFVQQEDWNAERNPKIIRRCEVLLKTLPKSANRRPLSMPSKQ